MTQRWTVWPRRAARSGLRPGWTAAVVAATLVLGGCSFDGLNSLPVPGAAGTGDGSYQLTTLMPSASNLTENAPVLMDDATVGSVGAIRVQNWQAALTLRLNRGTRVPVGSHVMVGITSVLGSLNLQIVQPPSPTQGFLRPGGRIDAANCPEQANIDRPTDRPAIPDVTLAQQVPQCSYPSVEQVLSSLSVVLNGGGLARAGDIVHELRNLTAGRSESLRALIPRATTLVSDLNRQRTDIVAAMSGLDRLTAQFTAQAPVIDKAIDQGPRILKVLVDERKNLTDTLGSVGRLSTTVDGILDRNGDDITTIVRNLVPVLDQLRDSKRSLTRSFGLLLTFPFAEQVIPKIIKGDYVNSVINLKLTDDRLSRVLLRSLGANEPARVYGPEALLGAPAKTAGRGVNPFTAPLTETTPAPNRTPAPAPTTSRGGGR